MLPREGRAVGKKTIIVLPQYFNSIFSLQSSSQDQNQGHPLLDNKKQPPEQNFLFLIRVKRVKMKSYVLVIKKLDMVLQFLRQGLLTHISQGTGGKSRKVSSCS